MRGLVKSELVSLLIEVYNYDLNIVEEAWFGVLDFGMREEGDFCNQYQLQ